MRPHINTDSPEQLNRTCDNCGTPFKTRRSYILKARARGCKPPRFCSRECYSAQKPAPKTKLNTAPPEVRFWSNVEKTERCWMWKGGTFKRSGYGRIMVNSKSMVASRFSYELAYGSVPVGLMVCHDCDKFYPPKDITYRRCVRPDHLFLGTAKDNQQDMTRKGRGRIGEKAGSAKLTETQVIEIRHRYKAGGISQEKLGKQYGVTQGLVKEIVHGRIWKHLPI